MKKRILSILLTLCMVLMLVPATAFAETPSERYSMTLNFKYGTLYGETGSYDLGSDYKAGDKYDISGELYDLTGYKPYKIVDCRSAEGDGVKGFITDHDIVLDVLYEVDGSLAVTLDGFEVGKTPNDITYSFESTIPGIEFSEDDILSDGWMQYIFDGDANDYCWEPMSTTKEFRADTQYKLLIDLDNKGLELAPAVTVNGRTPKSCKIATSNGVPIQLQIDCDLGTPAEHSQYTITYDGGEDSDPVTDVKTHGEDLPLRGETFTMDGFVQTGWVDKETGAIYDLGATYDEDRDATLYPYWEKLVTVTAPFTTTVALGDAGEPGETTFMLYLIDGTGNKLTYDDQYFFAEITTDGAGSYSGTMTITATGEWLYDMLYEGAFIWQYDGEEDGWTYDDTVWGVRLYMPEVAARSVDEASYELLLYPTYVMSDGSFNLDLNAGPVEEMTFTNTYTAHAYALKHDATHHWDECACKDVQNKELHKYGDWKVTKEATQTAVGEKEHTCTICGYTEKAEIAKLPATDTTDTTKNNQNTGAATSPNTGDNSHMALWIALLFVSGAGVIGTTVYGKKKRAK